MNRRRIAGARVAHRLGPGSLETAKGEALFVIQVWVPGQDFTSLASAVRRWFRQCVNGDSIHAWLQTSALTVPRDTAGTNSFHKFGVGMAKPINVRRAHGNVSPLPCCHRGIAQFEGTPAPIHSTLRRLDCELFNKSASR